MPWRGRCSAEPIGPPEDTLLIRIEAKAVLPAALLVVGRSPCLVVGRRGVPSQLGGISNMFMVS